MRALLTRRGFIAFSLALLVTRERAQSTSGCVHASAHAHQPGPHPTPRPGITAERVLSAAKLEGESRKVRAAFDEVRQVPGVVDGIRCHCGCASLSGHYSLLTCYEAPAMAVTCPICQGEGRVVTRLHRAGKSLDEIRVAVDAQFG